jgi:hypothetical protein
VPECILKLKLRRLKMCCFFFNDLSEVKIVLCIRPVLQDCLDFIFEKVLLQGCDIKMRNMLQLHDQQKTTLPGTRREDYSMFDDVI